MLKGLTILVLALFAYAALAERPARLTPPSEPLTVETAVMQKTDFSATGKVTVLSNGGLLLTTGGDLITLPDGNLAVRPERNALLEIRPETVNTETPELASAISRLITSLPKAPATEPVYAVTTFPLAAFTLTWEPNTDNGSVQVQTVVDDVEFAIPVRIGESEAGEASCSVTCGSGLSCSTDCPDHKACLAYCDGGEPKCLCVAKPKAPAG